MDAVCNVKRADAVCVNNLKNFDIIDESLLQERPDVKLFLPFRFYLYQIPELFVANQYNRYLGKK